MKLGLNKTTAAAAGAGWLAYKMPEGSVSLTKGWEQLKIFYHSIKDDGFQTEDLENANATAIATGAAALGLVKNKSVGGATLASLALGFPMFALGTMVGSGPSIGGGSPGGRRSSRRRSSPRRSSRRSFRRSSRRGRR